MRISSEELKNIIVQTMDSILVLLDIGAVFYTADHILLQRLEHVIGLKGTAVGWY